MLSMQSRLDHLLHCVPPPPLRESALGYGEVCLPPRELYLVPNVVCRHKTEFIPQCLIALFRPHR